MIVAQRMEISSPIDAFRYRGDFVRLREVSLSAPLPRRWSPVGGARGSRVTLAGRNLASWTSFNGLDAEVATAGSSQFVQPLLRSFAVRLDVSW